jgi:SulP family sulfate permease
MKALLAALFPFFYHWPQQTPTTLRKDLIAAFTGAIVVLPQGIAFATIAGMPPEYGLYAGIVPAIIAALYGSSWHLVSGPTTAASIVLFSVLSNFATPGTQQYIALALTLTFIVGITQLLMGMARLGTLVNFISHSVIIGFTTGAALLIATSQTKNFFGLSIPAGSEFFQTWHYLAIHIEDMNPLVTLVGFVTLVSGILAKRYFKAVPYMLTAMLVGSLVAFVLNQWLGQENTGITTVGALPQSLPPLSSPSFDLGIWRDLLLASFAVTLFALTEAVSISRALALKSGQQIDSNQEFIGQGLSNIFGSFFSSYVATGSFNRSAVNYEAGAQTPMAGVFAGILLLVAVLLIAPLVAYLPHAAMAGVLFLVAYGLIDWKHIKEILQVSRGETWILGTTVAATLLFDLEIAILVGVLFSLMAYLYRTSKPRIISRVPNPNEAGRHFTTDGNLPECPQLKILRIDGSLFFGAVPHVQTVIKTFEQKNPEQKHLLLVMAGVNFIDVAGADFLAQEAQRRKKQGGGLYLHRVKEGACEMLKRGHFMEHIGKDHIFTSKNQALYHIVRKHLDPEHCRRCDKRIFLECAAMPRPDDKPLKNWAEIDKKIQLIGGHAALEEGISLLEKDLREEMAIAKADTNQEQNLSGVKILDSRRLPDGRIEIRLEIPVGDKNP